MIAFRGIWHGGLAAVTLLASGCDPGKPPAPVPVVTPYAAVARGRIDIEGGLLEVAVPREGRISRILVHEGQSIHRGEQLIELDDTSARLAVAAAAAGLRETSAQLQTVAVQLAAATRRAERLRAAAEAGAGEGQTADDAQAQTQQLAAEREVALAARSAAATRLVTQRHELTLLVLTAAQDAVVTRVVAQTGGQVSPASGALLELLPQKPRIVRAELNEAYADAVQPQQPATVSPEDDPSRSWPAHVLRVSTIVGPAQFEDDAQRRSAERTVECILSLDGDTPLRVGQRVLARIGGPDKGAKD